MDLDENFELNYGQILKLTKDRGYTILEFSRAEDRDLNNIIEFWRYDSRKTKGESSWITEDDFKSQLKSYLSKFPIVNLETKPIKNSKK